MSRNRGPWVPALVFAGVLIFSGCEQASPTASHGVFPDAVVIGSSSALTGHAGFLGAQYTLGSQSWFNQVNDSGGIHGRRIVFRTLDDKYEPELTLENTIELIHEEDVFLLFDYVGTPTSVQILGTVHENEIPGLGFLTGAESLRTPFRPYLFHVRASYYSEVEGAITYFVDHLGLQKIAVMYQNDAFGLAVLAGVQLSMRRRGLEIYAIDTFERGSLELERPVQTMSSSGSEAIILVGTYSPLAKFIKEVHETGAEPFFHTVSFVGSEAFASAILEQGVDPERFAEIVVTQVVPSPSTGELGLVADYLKHLEASFPDQTPNYVSLEGYTNARVLTYALSRVGRELTREKLIETLEGMRNVDIGIGQNLTFGPFDHSGLDKVYYSRLDESGVFKVFDIPASGRPGQ